MSLAGTWYNELGSKLDLEVDDDGQLTGSYETGVSAKGCAEGQYEVAGRTDGETLGFVVNWKNAKADCESTTSWAGHYRPGDEGAEESLAMFWLLAESAGPAEEWESMMVGKDVFVRQTVAPATQTVRASNP